MRYRLRPDLPITSRSPQELRLGGLRALATLPDTPLVEMFIASAKLGTDRAELNRLARVYRSVSTGERDALIDALLAACEPIPDRAAPRRSVLVRATTASRNYAELVARELARRGHSAALAPATATVTDASGINFVIDVADHVLTAARYLPLVSAELPHLAIVREAGAHRIGPLVVSGSTPCLRCDDLARQEADSAWLAVAVQLASAPPPAHDANLAWCSALHVGMLASRFLESSADASAALQHPLAGWAWVLRDSGELQQVPCEYHAGCGCQALPGSVTVLPQRSHASQPATTTDAALAALG